MHRVYRLVVRCRFHWKEKNLNADVPLGGFKHLKLVVFVIFGLYEHKTTMRFPCINVILFVH